MSTLPYLPFARPTLDEDTIAGVAEVLRSGWITTGPQVKKFEAALIGLSGRIGRRGCSIPPPPRWKSPCNCAASAPAMK
jgi:hypothetical protein